MEDNLLEAYSLKAHHKLRTALRVFDADEENFEGIAMDTSTIDDDAVESPPVSVASMYRGQSVAVVADDTHPDTDSPTDEPHAIKGASLVDFDILAVIGRGGYGKVMQVRKRDTGVIFAMKSLRKKDVLARKQAQRTMIERRILSTIDHPFIVSLKFAFQVWRRD